MSKKSIILVIVILFIIFYSFYFKSLKTIVNKEVEVVVKDDGFYPDNLIINLGDTVKWTNEGERLHWPASNPHPDHTLYGGDGGCISSLLDSCKGLKKGETFSFKFDKLGVWPMHDHLAPGLIMVVEVVEDTSLVNSKVIDFSNLATAEEFRQISYPDQLNQIRSMADKDPRGAWEFLKDAFIVNGQVVGNAHEFAHIVGNVSYAKSGLSGVKICDDTFAFGCFHGVTEEMLLKEGVEKIPEIERGCTEAFPPATTQGYTGCIHGTGHGIYTWESGNLNKSLQDCDIFSEIYRPYCYDGVFMENSGSGDNIKVNESEPWDLCINLGEQYHRSCARYQSQIFLRSSSSNNSLSLVGKYCSRGPSDLMRDTCFQSLGFYVSQTSLGKVDEIWKRCGEMPDSGSISKCVTGAAVETIFQDYENSKESASILCNKLKEEQKIFCVNNINNVIK